VTRVDRRTALFSAFALLLGCERAGVGAVTRVVSLSPSTTEALFAIGAGDLLVGRSRFCDFPAEAAKLPSVGGYADPSLEAIVALRPTLVVGARGPAGSALEETLRARGIATYFPETESIAQIEESILGLGRLCARDAEAHRVVEATRARVVEVEDAVRGRARVRAVLLFDVAPLVAAGPSSFPDELVRRGGGTNLVTSGGAYPTIGIEHLLALDPDILLDASVDMDGAAGGQGGVLARRDAPGYRELRAVRHGGVRRIDSAAVLRPGPRIGEGLAAIARALQGALIPPLRTP
jgi:iron complex transport system substrate-binding protein